MTRWSSGAGKPSAARSGGSQAVLGEAAPWAGSPGMRLLGSPGCSLRGAAAAANQPGEKQGGCSQGGLRFAGRVVGQWLWRCCSPVPPCGMLFSDHACHLPPHTGPAEDALRRYQSDGEEGVWWGAHKGRDVWNGEGTVVVPGQPFGVNPELWLTSPASAPKPGGTWGAGVWGGQHRGLSLHWLNLLSGRCCFLLPARLRSVCDGDHGRGEGKAPRRSRALLRAGKRSARWWQCLSSSESVSRQRSAGFSCSSVGLSWRQLHSQGCPGIIPLRGFWCRWEPGSVPSAALLLQGPSPLLPGDGPCLSLASVLMSSVDQPEQPRCCSCGCPGRVV